MAITTPAPAAAPAPPKESGVRPYRWTREAYRRLIDAGIFGEDDRIQLIEGELFELPGQREPHAVAVGLAQDTLMQTFGAGFHVRVQLPLALGEYSEPEPDLSVVRGRRRDYLGRHPGLPDTVVLAVEVADSTLSFDRHRKASHYAARGIPEYWIVNLQERVLEVYRDPGPMPDTHYGAGYHTRLIVETNGHVAPLAALGTPVAVADLLP